MTTSAISIPLHQAPQPLMQYCKCENESRCSHFYLHGALVGNNGDPQTHYMKEGVLEQTGAVFKFQQLSTIQS